MHSRHEIMLRVTDDGYQVVCDAAKKQHAKLKTGALVSGRIARSRSIHHHRLYWKVLECAVNATDWWDTPELLHIALKEATGHFTIVRLMNGRMVKVPGSTSFDEMNQDEFNSYCEAAFRILAEKLEMSIENLLEEAHAYA
jgi:hypothetical protein